MAWPPARRVGRAPSAAACRAAPSSSASTARAARTATATSSSTRSRARRRASRRGPRLGLSVVAQGRRRGRPQPRQAAAARGLRDARPSALPAGHDVVVVARPDARELAEREGLDGHPRRRWPSCSSRRAAGGGAPAMSACAPRRDRADPRSTSAHLAGAPAALQVRADVLGATPRRRSASSAYCAGWCSPAGGCCAATRGATGASTRSRRSASSATPTAPPPSA